MPTYEYECSKCGLVYEHFQSIKAEPLKTCIHPEGCRHPGSKAEVKRLLGTGAGIIFKGSGFYTTDYRSKEYREAAKKDNSSSSSSTSAESSSTSSASTKESGGATPSNGPAKSG